MTDSMTITERQGLIALAAVIASRMLGLFLLIPVLSIYAHELPDSTPLLIGVAFGIYGLTQAFLQIPFGYLSDKFGRKPMIILGLSIIIIGSIVAAYSESVWGLILGRGLQGAGAISSVVLALASDITRETQRTKAMAILGISIAASFSLSLVLGPILMNWIQPNSLFWITGILAFLSIFILIWRVPTPNIKAEKEKSIKFNALFKTVLDKNLIYLIMSILILHALLAMTFISLPFLLREQLGLPVAAHWIIYLPVILGSFLLMIPAVMQVDRYQKHKVFFLLAIVFIALGLLGLILTKTSLWQAGFSLLAFFLGFNMLEALLPSWVSKIAPSQHKGMAMGVFSTMQFTGIFLGGIFAGLLLDLSGVTAVFLISLMTCFAWFIVMTYGLINPPRIVKNEDSVLE